MLDESTKKKSTKRGRRVSLFSALFQPMTSRQQRRRSFLATRPMVTPELSVKSDLDSIGDSDSYELDLAVEKSRQRAASHLEEPEPSNPLLPIQNRPSSETSSRLVPEPDSMRNDKPRKSPLVEQFCNVHKISLGSNTLNYSSSSSSNNSSRPGSPVRSVKPLSEQDQRLINWRLMAARSMCSASSLHSSDSELEMLDCHSPALVVNCSDDTSCSSVELVWTRSRAPRIVPTATESRSEVKPTSELNESANLARANSCRASFIKSGPRDLLHRLAIFELARPSRAIDKQIGRRSRSSIASGRTSADVTSPTQWVANPLFSADEDGTLNTSATSHESLFISNSGCPPKRLLRSDRCDSLDSLDSGSSGQNSLEDRIKNEKTVLRVKRKQKKTNKKSSRSSTRLDKSRDEADENGNVEEGSRRDNIYFNHIMKLDRRIKSNVSSIKSQLSEKLSDTGKRASVFADQLISSIKETTKEQLSHGNKLQKDDNRFSSFGSLLRPETEKTKLFSLIYMHQQQANGQQVITRQPIATSALPSLAVLELPLQNKSNQNLDSNESTSQEQQCKPIRPPPPKYQSQRASLDPQALEVMMTSAQNKDRMQVSISDLLELAYSEVASKKDEGAKLEGGNKEENVCDKTVALSCSPTSSFKRKIVRRRLKRNPASDFGNRVKPEDTSDEDDFYHQEYAKFRRSLDRKPMSANHRTITRSLNYWRRFRMRKLGIEWPPVDFTRSSSLDFADLKNSYYKK